MKVLALDTTTRAGSTALAVDGRVVDERSGDGTRTYAQRLPAEITTLAAANHCALAEIDLFAVATGPGSFTGMRIGIATIQGFAHVHGRRVFAVSALEALAHAASAGLGEAALIGAWMDAHRRDVFAALYRVTPAAPFSRPRLAAIDGPAVDSPDATLVRWRTLGVAPAVIVGDAAVMYADDIRRAATSTRIVPPPPLAGTIALLASRGAADAIEPAAVRPLYVRRPDVEIARDEQLRRAAAGTSDN